MGYSKIIAKAAGKVVIVHQLDEKGEPYAEDVTIEAQEGVPASRVDWTAKDGQVRGDLVVVLARHARHVIAQVPRGPGCLISSLQPKSLSCD